MSDVWTDHHEEALRDALRIELSRACGGCRTLRDGLAIEAAVLSRLILLGLDALARLDGGPDDAMDAVIRPLATEHLMSMAHRLRMLGLTRDDVRRLDLGRRRRRATIRERRG